MIFKLTLLEFFVRLLPEAFFLVLAGYAYSRVRIKKKLFLISTSILWIIGSITRLLPLRQEIHFILNLIGLMLLLIFINKIETIKAITSAIIIFIITLISEGIMISLYTNVFHIDMNLVYSDPGLIVIYGLPSLLIVAIIVSLYYIIISKMGKLKDVSY